MDKNNRTLITRMAGTNDIQGSPNRLLAIRPAGDDAYWNGVMLGFHNPLEVINPRFETGDRNGVNLGVERKPIERVGDNRFSREFQELLWPGAPLHSLTRPASENQNVDS